jgi:NADP-dependent 3-hydroxy acid dehydrogenase YdfG
MANPMPFSGKVVTVTGAAHGIGLATVNYLVSRGASVSMADTDKHALERTEEKLRKEFADANLIHRALDVRDRKLVQDWIESTKGTFGKIDCCVNNAGNHIFHFAAFLRIYLTRTC